MRQYTSENLVIHPGHAAGENVVVEVTPALAGWEHIHFQVRRLRAGEEWAFETGPHELALVVLSGTLSVQSNRGRWADLGQRATVFAGLPYALYLPPDTTFTVEAAIDVEFAVTWTPVAAGAALEPRLVTPADVVIEIRGGDNATRQINRILPPGFPCARLVVVEVYTPAGNWSSYPPHKHDVHKTDAEGRIVEADLEEIYYYKIDHPQGFAIQRVYTDAESPLHRAGYPIDAAVIARTNDVVLVPEGYHPVTSPEGYTAYYLNVLVGSAQTLAATDDPAHAWVKESFKTRDPRVPLYDISAGTLEV
jgi:5-deoxy-glucuronate isomerase